MRRSLLFFLLSLLAFLPRHRRPSRQPVPPHGRAGHGGPTCAPCARSTPSIATRLPPMYRLACDLTVADDDCDDARFVECIDSLDHFYSHHIPAANRAVWAVQKAAALCRLGRYPDAAAYCERELKRLDHDPQPSVQAKQLVYYRDKGAALRRYPLRSGPDTRTDGPRRHRRPAPPLRGNGHLPARRLPRPNACASPWAKRLTARTDVLGATRLLLTRPDRLARQPTVPGPRSPLRPAYWPTGASGTASAGSAPPMPNISTARTMPCGAMPISHRRWPAVRPAK